MLSAILFLILFSFHAFGYDGVIHFEGEKHLKNVRQLTRGGANAEAYFSFDNKKITFQASGGNYGTKCDQIYEMDLTVDPTKQTARRISNGIGATTCSFFLSDNKNRIFASTFLVRYRILVYIYTFTVKLTHF
jgi:hypothetical protein